MNVDIAPPTALHNSVRRAVPLSLLVVLALSPAMKEKWLNKKSIAVHMTTLMEVWSSPRSPH